MRLLFLVLALAVAATPALAEPVEVVYAKHCAECHDAGRLGGMGPALLPENLGRLKQKDAVDVIRDGRVATQMPGYGHKIDDAAIAALVDYIYKPLPSLPVWGIDEINASRIVHNDPAGLPDKPTHSSDPLNLFTVVETGDHHVTILDGDTFTPLWRFKSRFALHGGAKYSPDGRFVYLASRDGWVSKYDLHSLKPVAEVRAGINTRNIAVSGDGRWVAVANYLPNTLVILDSRTLKPVKLVPVIGPKGKTSRVSAVYAAPPRQSFIAALKDIPEIWELSYKDDPEPVPMGLIHNYQPGMEEGAFDYGPFPVRRIRLDDYLDDFFFDQSYVHLIGAARNSKNGQVVNMRVGRKIADIDLAGMPHLGSGITFEYKGRPVMATPHLGASTVSVIDLETWDTVRRIETEGPGFFMRSHDSTPYAWTDVFFGPNKDKLHIIDKRTLEIVKTLIPEPGKTGAHVEFTRDGKYALVSVWDMDGALVVYDAVTFAEIKRIPMKKPSGKYNVFNKITYSSGTSH